MRYFYSSLQPKQMRYLVVLSLCLFCLFACDSPTKRVAGYEVHGIDVSHYQAKINWETIAQQDISFAFVKATEGESHTDKRYTTNWSELKKVGIKRGAYHFFHPSRSVYKQAKNFIDLVHLEAGDLPPVLDIEVTNGASSAITRIRIKAWLEMVEAHYRVRPIIYTNLRFYKDFIAGNFDDYPIWIARYNQRRPYLGKDRNWHFWQYGNRGQLKGIDGYVDFNVFRGDIEDLEALCIPEAQPISAAR